MFDRGCAVGRRRATARDGWWTWGVLKEYGRSTTSDGSVGACKIVLFLLEEAPEPIILINVWLFEKNYCAFASKKTLI
jgi:hypothetical protein